MSAEAKVIGGIALATLIILVGGVLFLTKSENLNVKEDQIISRSGLHWHPRLTILIKGEKQELPADFGLGALHSPIHTHAADSKQGILHMEMSGLVTKDETKLGKWFQLWGKQFNSNCIFERCNSGEGTVKVFINRQQNSEFENYKMHDGDKIEIKYE